MDYENEEESFSDMFPPEPEYPPIIPGELTVCLGRAQEMRKECDFLKSALDKALEKIRIIRCALDA